MLGQQLVIDSRLVVEAVEEPSRNELNEILVALLVLAQQD
jgi:hypothetical protein